MRRTVADSYLEPLDIDIKAMAEKYNVKSWNNDFVLDLCNYTAGGKFKEEHEYLKDVREALPKFNPEEEDQEYYEHRISKSMKNHKNKFESIKEFCENLNLDLLEGNSPLDKIMNMLSKLQYRSSDGEGVGDEGIPLVAADKSEGKDFNDSLEQFQSLPKDDKDMLRGIHLDSRVIQEFLKINSRIDKITKMKAHKTSKLIPSREGSQTRLRMLKDTSEVLMASPDLWALPKSLQAYKIATRQALVKERVIREEKKQFLYLMVDASGSMDENDRCGAALAILINRLKAVKRGDASLIFTWFNSHISTSKVINTADDAQDLISSIESKKFATGSTDIDDCLREAVEDINNKMKMPEFANTDRPELCIVTDGDDRVYMQKNEMDGIKLHSFLVGHNTDNDGLTKLAKSTGGVAMHI